MPSIESLQQWYRERYREDYKAATAPRLTHVLRAGRLALQRWNWLTGQQGYLSPSRSLDIGASSGEFVYLLKSRAIEAQGLEPHHGYSAHAREHLGLDITTGTLHERLAEFPLGRFDLISLFHVLEHLPDPVQSLKRIREHLSDRGRVYLEVPDMAAMCSPANAFFRAHTLYFTSQSLVQTAQAAGFEVLADNFTEHDNLRVVLAPADSTAARASFNCDHALARGKALRTWPRYLRQRIAEGYLWQRLRQRRDEKQQASRYPDGRHLLQALYGTADRPGAIEVQRPT
jgi:2-polyprenyl-3-methyl-5-hydroxy-6-metoxy-1,4-benzoquinol methylase